MTKAVAILTMLAVLVPAAFFICGCCPAMAQDNILKIESPDCRGCCPEAIETAKDCAVIQNKASQTLPYKIADFLNASFIKTKTPVIAVETRLVLPDEAPAPASPLVLSSILRI